jgi:pimeloyl-ACP methyl ester carboxylesterase
MLMIEQAVPLAERMIPLVQPVVEPVLRPVVNTVMDVVPDPLLHQLAGPLQRLAGPTAARALRRPLAVRHGGRDLDPTPERLAAAFPDATGRMLVLVPGVGESESVWGPEPTYAARLQDVHGWTPVWLRHGADTTLGESAVVLSALLQQLVDGWPVPVERIVLLGHGLGGLAARNAAGVRPLGGTPWTSLVTEVVALGSPYLAVEEAPTVPAVGTVGRRLDQALAGIVVADPQIVDAPLIEGADYLLITDRIATRANPMGRVVGDVLWWRHRGRRRVQELFPTAERFALPTTQEPLANHRDIHDALLRWLG